MPRRGDMSTIRYTHSAFTHTFRANFSSSFPRKRLLWEEKIVVLCLDVIMIAFFPKKRTVKFSFCAERMRKY